jgi:hypothetical protein
MAIQNAPGLHTGVNAMYVEAATSMIISTCKQKKAFQMRPVHRFPKELDILIPDKAWKVILLSLFNFPQLYCVD